MTDSSGNLRRSHAACRRVARAAGSNFYPCFFLLGPARRRAMVAVYAFMRHTDDLADSDHPADQRRQAVARWRSALAGALTSPGRQPEEIAGGWLLPALADTARRYQIPHRHFFDILDGVEMDLAPHRYETFDELARYCRRVATAVGMACLHIWGFDGEAAFPPAGACGLAFQMTNILRDLKEDAARGRVYLPQEDLRRFDYTEEDLRRGVADDRFLRLMRFQIERTELLYREAAPLVDHLEPAGRRIFSAMWRLYHQLLLNIRSAPAVVLRQRVHVRRSQKLAIGLWTLCPFSARVRLP